MNGFIYVSLIHKKRDCNKMGVLGESIFFVRICVRVHLPVEKKVLYHLFQ